MQSQIFGARQKHPIGHHRGLLGPDGGCPWGRGACSLNKGTIVCLQSIWRCPPRQQAQQRGSLLWACDWFGVGVGVWTQRLRSADVSGPPGRCTSTVHAHILCWFKRRRAPDVWQALSPVARVTPGTNPKQRPFDQRLVMPKSGQEDSIYRKVR